ncbi:MAG: DUF3501 family protein [Polyangiales bacterium]
MRPIERGEILGLKEYEPIRERFYRRIVEMKRPRRVALGEDLCILFENRDTVLWQIQEMIRTERITAEPGIAHEIETYNEQVPAAHELSATLFIQIPDAERRNEMLTRLCGIEEHIVFEVESAQGVERCRATFEEGRRDSGRAAAVQYLKFPLTPAAEKMLRSGIGSVSVRLDHPAMSLRVPLAPATVASLALDVS